MIHQPFYTIFKRLVTDFMRCSLKSWSTSMEVFLMFSAEFHDVDIVLCKMNLSVQTTVVFDDASVTDLSC